MGWPLRLQSRPKKEEDTQACYNPALAQEEPYWLIFAVAKLECAAIPSRWRCERTSSTPEAGAIPAIILTSLHHLLGLVVLIPLYLSSSHLRLGQVSLRARERRLEVMRMLFKLGSSRTTKWSDRPNAENFCTSWLYKWVQIQSNLNCCSFLSASQVLGHSALN